MTFLVDNDVPEAIARVVAQAGHRVARLRELLPRESDDAAVLAFAHAQEAVLVTCNRGHFLALAAHHPHAGLIVVIRRRTRASEQASKSKCHKQVSVLTIETTARCPPAGARTI